MSDYEPSPELVEAADTEWSLWWNGVHRPQPLPSRTECMVHALTAAVAYRHPDGRPELVPWEQVRELVEATEGACGVLYASSNQYARLRAALAPWKDNA